MCMQNSREVLLFSYFHVTSFNQVQDKAVSILNHLKTDDLSSIELVGNTLKDVTENTDTLAEKTQVSVIKNNQCMYV